MKKLDFTRVTGGGEKAVTVPVADLVIAGWTGRDRMAMEKHMAELEAIGIARPKTAPIFYRVSEDLLTQEDTIRVVGEDSSGEVEFFVLALADGLWIGLGSDHTDRKVEAYNVTVSKQSCAKPIARDLWHYDDVIEHWDQLVLRSFALEDGARALYQEGPVTTMLPAEELIGRYSPKTGDLETNTLMFCGTLAVQGGVRSMSGFEMELEDTVLGRKIRHQYAIETLPNEG